MRTSRLMLTLGIAGLLAWPALAAPPSALVPVDQAVGDIDPLATSMRQVNTGLRSDGEQTSLYTPAVLGQASQQAVYYRLGPGFRARVDRMHYLIPTPVGKDRIAYAWNISPRHDGQFIEVLPGSVVYELSPAPTMAPPAAVSSPAPPQQVSGRVDPRVDGRIDGRVPGTVAGTVTPVPPTE